MDDNLEIEQLFNELSEIESSISIKDDFSVKTEDSFEVDEPIYDEYYSSTVFDYLSEEFEAEEKGAKPRLKDPKGGLTAAGRAHFKRTEGANLKPGVKGPADTPEKMRRKGSFLTRFFTNPSGPMKDEKGRATRLALSAAAWGEPVPGDAAAAAKLAAKGRRLLERYENTKKKNDEVELDEKQLPGQTIGQQGSGAIGAGDAGDGVDRDGDGIIFDGTDREQRAPYKRSSNADYEKRRRQYVRGQLNAQGIKPNARVQDRSQQERQARARARAQFDRQTYADGIRSQQEAARKRSINSVTDSAQRVAGNRGVGNVTDAATRRGQTDARRPTSADDRRTADRADNSPPSRRIDSAERQRAARGVGSSTGGDQPVRAGVGRTREPNRRPDSAERIAANRGTPSASDAATRRGQTDSRRPVGSDDRRGADRADASAPNRRPDSADRQRAARGIGNSTGGDQPVRAGSGRRDTRPGASSDRPGADRADRSAPNRRPDSADRASRSEYKPGYILEDADGQLQQYDGQPPKNKPYIREQRDGQLQQYGPPRRRGSGKRDF